MENNKEIFEQFKAMESGFNVKPDPLLWEELEGRLHGKSALKRVKLFKISAYAAVLIIMVAAVISLNQFLSHQKNVQFVSAEILADYETEYLSTEYGKNFFNMESFAIIRNAYSKFAGPAPINLNGNYRAENGEIGFEIFQDELNYQLQFNFEGLPTFNLDLIEGNTITFISVDGKTIKMNLEDSGLSLTDSNFFHEYKGYLFEKL